MNATAVLADGNPVHFNGTVHFMLKPKEVENEKQTRITTEICSFRLFSMGSIHSLYTCILTEVRQQIPCCIDNTVDPEKYQKPQNTIFDVARAIIIF